MELLQPFHITELLVLMENLPFDYPTDMKYFRETTKGATIIMGRKTFESIGRALPKRRNIVISRTKVEVAWRGNLYQHHGRFRFQY